MKKFILNIGKALHKKEQMSINGGNNCDCPAPRDPISCASAGGFWVPSENKCIYPPCYCDF